MKKFIQEVSSVFKKILIEYSQQTKIYYRIVKLPESNDPYLYFQVVGTSVLLKALPENLMREGFFLNFETADVAIITHLGTKNELSKIKANSKRSIFKKVFRSKKTLFLVKKKDSDEDLEEKLASEIFEDKYFMRDITNQEALDIGYALAEEHYQEALDQKEKSAIE
jgi:hypothetical protein